MKKIVLIILLFTILVNYTNAQSWSALGTGIGTYNNDHVNAFETYNGELYVGGSFYTVDNLPAKGIAKWNGTNWSSVGNGVGGDVYSLCVFNGELYVGGSFYSAGDVPAHDIARWNGTAWTIVGNIQANGVKAMTVFNGELYAAGYFTGLTSPSGTSIAKWSGSSWTAVAPENDLYSVYIESMVVYNGSMYVAGAYYLIGGGGLPEYYSITKWDGVSWSTLLTIPATYTLDGALGNISSMAVYNGELYIGGTFSLMIDSIPTYQIAKWNGTNWSAVGSGINPAGYPLGGDSDGSGYSFVQSLGVYNGSLYAGGHFDSCGTIATRNIAKWNGTDWSALSQGVNGYVYDMIGTDTALFVGGWFDYVDNNLQANKIAKWSYAIDSCISAPLQPTIIHGNDSVCNNTLQTYWVNTVTGATSYTWQLPQGWTGNSTSNSISVNVGTSDGVISVSANNNCGSSVLQTLFVFVRSTPQQPILINGNDSVCEGSHQTYFIDPVPGATDYYWTVPVDWSGYSNSDTLSVIAGGANGELSVTAYNDCGSSIPQILPIAVSLLPKTPDYIDGDTRVCKRTSHLYFIPQVQNATDYTWELPTGWNGSSATDSIIILPDNLSGTIYVKANNGCGSSPNQTLYISIDSIPHKPGNIIGNNYTCTNYLTNYSVDKVTGAKDYKWFTGDGIIERRFPGNYTSVSWKKAGTYELSVKAVNDCGLSEEQKLIVIVTDFNADDPFDIKIFPNPSNGACTLTAKMIQDKLIRVEILTMSGQTIYNSGSRPGLNNYTQFIDLKKLPQDAYLAKIVVEDKVFTRTIIKNQ